VDSPMHQRSKSIRPDLNHGQQRSAESTFMSSASIRGIDNFAVFFGFTLLYLANLSQNLSITHDSIAYLQSIANADPVFHANHLLYEHFGILISQLGSRWFSAQQSLGIASAFSGGFVVLVTYRMLRSDFNVQTYTSLCAVGVIGFSYGIWYYSIAVEIYIFQLALLMLCLKLLFAKKIHFSTVATCALVHSAAVLLHQSSVLFGVVPVVAICCLADRNWADKARMLLIYLTLCAIVVGGSYILAAHSLDRLNSIQQFTLWAAGNAPHDDWSGFSWRSVLLAAVGLARALVSFSFLFSIPELHGVLTTLFPANNLSDEMFLVRNIEPAHAIFLGGAVIFLAVSLLVFAIIAASQLLRAGFSYRLILLITWLLPTVAFSVVFNPSNVDLWIAAFVLCIVIIAVGMTNAPRHFNHLFAVAAILVFITNYTGVVRPANDSNNDYYRQAIIFYANIITRDDVLVIADGWPIADHLNYYDQFTHYSVAERFASGMSADSTATELRNLVSNTGTIFVHQNLYQLPSHSLNEWGESYATFLEELTKHFCNGNRISGAQFPDLVKVSCLL